MFELLPDSSSATQLIGPAGFSPELIEKEDRSLSITNAMISLNHQMTKQRDHHQLRR